LRNYGEIAHCVEALADWVKTRILGAVADYPIYGVSWGGQDKPLAWLTGGVHGD